MGIFSICSDGAKDSTCKMKTDPIKSEVMVTMTMLVLKILVLFSEDEKRIIEKSNPSIDTRTINPRDDINAVARPTSSTV
jgi:hypothetical protein